MATISSDREGRRRLLFVDATGKRRSIKLGKMPKKTADGIKARVEHINAANISQDAIDGQTAAWLAKCEGWLYRKLARAGLVADRSDKPTNPTLEAFLTSYIDGRHGLKPNTLAHLKRAKGDLVKHFGADRRLDTITAADADAFRLGLIKRPLADNTVRRICGRAKQFFGQAVCARCSPTVPSLK